MPDRSNNVLQKTPPTKQRVQDELARDWARCFPVSRTASVAERMDCSPGTINNGRTGAHLPELHTVLASLLVDPTALQTVMGLYGFKAVPLQAEAANDLDTLAKVSHLAGKWAEALADGRRDHRETCDLADAIRPLLIALSAVVSEAERIKAA